MISAKEENEVKNVVSSLNHNSKSDLCFFSLSMSRGISRGEYEQEKYIQCIALFCCNCYELLF